MAMPFMYHYDDSEVDKSQDSLIRFNLLEERTRDITNKIKITLTDLLHKAASISKSKNDLYGDIMDNSTRVLMYSLPTKLLMNTSKMFGDSIKGNLEDNTVLDVLTYALYIYKMLSNKDYSDLHPILHQLYEIIQQRQYEYNSADLVYDRLSMSDIASMIHIKAIRIKNLVNSLDKLDGNADIESFRTCVLDNIYDLMIYAAMIFLKLHRV